MKLTHLCDAEFRYTAPMTFVEPYEGIAGYGFGGGEGYVRGERLRGILRFAIAPRRREDDVYLPDITAAVTTDDGAHLIVRLQAYSVVDEKGGRTIIGSVTMASEGGAYTWLNQVYCLAEGIVDRQAGAIRVRIYACESELGGELPAGWAER
ncbi:MAG: hypothetical protein WD535_03730 [Thermaerobacterales bacterium]